MSSNLSHGAKVFFKKNGATILTCTGVAGVIGTSILTATGTTKANELLAEAKTLKGEVLTKKEKLVVAAPAYVPALLTGLGTVACIFGANVLNKKHQESLASAYILLNQSFKDYRNKVMELYGDDANNQIDEAILEESKKPRQRLH